MGDKVAPKKRGGRKPILAIAPVAASLVKHDGNISCVARQFGVGRSAVQAFIGRHADLQTVLIDSREGLKDDAESVLGKAVRDGEPWAVCFYLKTQAQDRGYVEKQKHEHSGQGQLVITRVVVERGADGGGATDPPGGAALPSAG